MSWYPYSPSNWNQSGTGGDCFVAHSADDFRYMIGLVRSGFLDAVPSVVFLIVLGALNPPEEPPPDLSPSSFDLILIGDDFLDDFVAVIGFGVEQLQQKVDIGNCWQR